MSKRVKSAEAAESVNVTVAVFGPPMAVVGADEIEIVGRTVLTAIVSCVAAVLTFVAGSVNAPALMSTVAVPLKSLLGVNVAV